MSGDVNAAADHADTIRRALEANPSEGHLNDPRSVLQREAFTALDELVAERQQANDERDAAQAELKALRAFASGVEHLSLPGLRAECAALLEQKQQLAARCEQAIDALREADERLSRRTFTFESLQAKTRGVHKLIHAALVSLGETEQPRGYTREDARKDTMRP